MTDLEHLLAVAGLLVTMLVVAGMILITPHGTVSIHPDAGDANASNPSRAVAPDPPPPVTPDDASPKTEVRPLRQRL